MTMPGCPTITLNGVTQQVWDRMLAEARRSGVPVPADGSGTVSAQGATAEYAWDAASATLTVTFTWKPTWIECASIEQQLRQAVRACGGS
jgi:YD repeat-containing protein